MEEFTDGRTQEGQRLSLKQQSLAVAILAVTVLLVGAGILLFDSSAGMSKTPSYVPPELTRFVPTPEQMASLTIETVRSQPFHTEIVTDGYVAPNGGLVAPGLAAVGTVEHGLPLLAGQSSDILQAESDLATAKAQMKLDQANEKRQHELYQADGAALKDWQQSQLDLATASAAFASARGRLRMLGKTDAEIAAVQNAPAPSAQGGEAAPATVFAVGNSSTVWLIANVREADASSVHPGDEVQVRVPAYPQEIFQATISYVASVIDPVTHRLVVGAKIANPGSKLKPNMLATCTILAGPAAVEPYVTQNAIISEGDATRVWVSLRDGSLALRAITIGRANDGHLEVTKGLAAGENIVTGGALFIDRAAQNS